MRRSIAPCVILVLFLSASGLADGSKDKDLGWRRTFALTLDGEKFSVTEGKAQTLRSKKHAGRSYAVVVRMEKQQTYVTPALQFKFDLFLVVEDGSEGKYEAMYVSHPTGADLQLYDEAAHPDDTLDALMVDAVKLAKRFVEEDGATGIKTTKPKQEKLPHGMSLVAKITYKDEDGKPWVRYVRQMRIGNRFVLADYATRLKHAPAVDLAFSRVIKSIRAR